MCKLGVGEWLVSAVMSMYVYVWTVLTAVRTVHSNSHNFEVKIGMSKLGVVVCDNYGDYIQII